MAEFYFSPYFPFVLNFFLSLIIARKIGSKKHIGDTYTFWFGVGFSFIVALILAYVSAPLDKPKTHIKRNGAFYILLVLFVVLVVRSPIGAYEYYEKAQAISPDYSEFSFLADGMKDEYLRKMLVAIGLFIGSITGIVYLLNVSKKPIQNSPAA